LSDSDAFRHPEPQRVTGPTLAPAATLRAARAKPRCVGFTLWPRLADT
jgi:hypothetical protein